MRTLACVRAYEHVPACAQNMLACVWCTPHMCTCINLSSAYYVLSFVQAMAMSDDNLRLASAFDGVFTSLPRDHVCGGDYLAVPYLFCNPECRIYVASVSSSVVGGSLINGVPQRETLCVLLIAWHCGRVLCHSLRSEHCRTSAFFLAYAGLLVTECAVVRAG